MTGFKVEVRLVRWIQKEVDWEIQLDWGDYGSSRVWARDEGDIWVRWIDLN